MINRKELKALSKEQLKGQWLTVVLITLVFSSIQFIMSRLELSYESSFLVSICALLVTFSVPILSNALYLKLTRGVKVKFDDIFVSGSTYLKSIGVTVLQGLIMLPVMIVMGIIVAMVGFGLIASTGILEALIIPSSIEHFMYNINFGELFKAIILVLLIVFIISIPILILSFYMFPAVILMVEDDSRGVGECISTSFSLMRGNVWSFIVLQISFIGWGILCIFTLGIGILWLNPYINTVNMNFFNQLIGYKEVKENQQQLY